MVGRVRWNDLPSDVVAFIKGWSTEGRRIRPPQVPTTRARTHPIDPVPARRFAGDGFNTACLPGWRYVKVLGGTAAATAPAGTSDPSKSVESPGKISHPPPRERPTVIENQSFSEGSAMFRILRGEERPGTSIHVGT